MFFGEAWGKKNLFLLHNSFLSVWRLFLGLLWVSASWIDPESFSYAVLQHHLSWSCSDHGILELDLRVANMYVSGVSYGSVCLPFTHIHSFKSLPQPSETSLLSPPFQSRGDRRSKRSQSERWQNPDLSESSVWTLISLMGKHEYKWGNRAPEK